MGLVIFRAGFVCVFVCLITKTITEEDLQATSMHALKWRSLWVLNICTFYSNDIAKMFPQIGSGPQRTNFPKQSLTPAFSLYCPTLVTIYQASSSLCLQPLTALNLRTISISIFYLGVEETTRDFPNSLLHQLVTRGQTQPVERDRVPGSVCTALRGATLR